MSDGSTLYDTIIYDSTRIGADNLHLLRNIAGQLLSEKPRIYDVELNTGSVGEAADVTAFIFDDDLSSVRMTIVGPNGSEITSDLVETLGYKFVYSFTMDSAGFFEITIIAEDDAGHIQTYQKVVLVAIDAADDEFILTVIMVLLAVVGAGLGYVGILRMGGKRKVKRKIEREWTPQWEDDSSPPAIE